MKVVMMGASGSGKTTLAKAIAEGKGIPYVENSAGLILTAEGKEELKRVWNYAGNDGQVGVVNRSHLFPDFGRAFQHWILTSRVEILSKYPDIIIDRSPLDAAVFYINQVAVNQSQEYTDDFINKCCDAMIVAGVTHVIRVPLLNPSRQVEDNGSRCHNWFFQKKIDLLFDLILNEFMGRIKTHIPLPKIHIVKHWDWEKRLADSMHFLSQGYY